MDIYIFNDAYRESLFCCKLRCWQAGCDSWLSKFSLTFFVQFLFHVTSFSNIGITVIQDKSVLIWLVLTVVIKIVEVILSLHDHIIIHYVMWRWLVHIEETFIDVVLWYNVLSSEMSSLLMVIPWMLSNEILVCSKNCQGWCFFLLRCSGILHGDCCICETFSVFIPDFSYLTEMNKATKGFHVT